MIINNKTIKILEKDRKTLKDLLEGEPTNKELLEIMKELIVIDNVMILLPCMQTVYKGETKDVPISILVEELKNPLKRQDYPLFANSPPERLKGAISYTLLHEIGEAIKVKQMFLLTKKTLINIPPISDITPSDVYGDFLCSAFAPVSPEKQLDLFDSTEELINHSMVYPVFKKEQKQKLKQLTIEEYGFVTAQMSTYAQNIINKKSMVFKNLKKLIAKCKGLNLKERKEAYLTFHDEDAQSVMTKIKRLGRLPKDIEFNAYFFDILNGGIEW